MLLNIASIRMRNLNFFEIRLKKVGRFHLRPSHQVAASGRRDGEVSNSLLGGSDWGSNQLPAPLAVHFDSDGAICVVGQAIFFQCIE